MRLDRAYSERTTFSVPGLAAEVERPMVVASDPQMLAADHHGAGTANGSCEIRATLLPALAVHIQFNKRVRVAFQFVSTRIQRIACENSPYGNMVLAPQHDWFLI